MEVDGSDPIPLSNVGSTQRLLDRSIHGRFESYVEVSKKSIAVQSPTHTLTYSELNVRANKIAHKLISMGTQLEDLVAVSIERSVANIAALLGILKAGCAYVPIDGRFPKSRVASIIADAKPKAVISLGDIVDEQIAHLFLNQNGSLTDDEVYSDVNPALCVTENHLAFVLFTSGSTGNPKGVMLEHKGAINHVEFVLDKIYRGAAAWMPQISSITFDASIKQIFGPIMSGRCIWLPEPGAEADPRALIRMLSQKDHVYLNCVPTTWRLILQEFAAGARPPQSLRKVILGGENFDQEMVRRSLEYLPNLEIVNLYGPTEATGIATYWEVKENGEVHIGSPIANVSVWVCTQNRRPASDGETGELLIGGKGIARGYLNSPKLTEKQFLNDPVIGKQTGRIYRSGDLAIRQRDGTFRLAGRVDRQIKINGIRIELSEVERCICESPWVNEAFVDLDEDRYQTKRLLAYVVLAKAHADDEEVIQSLRDSVPWFMYPASIRQVSHMPVSINGKIDNENLNSVVVREIRPISSRHSPCDPIETSLIRLWFLLTGVEVQDTASNFFDIGGSSFVLTNYLVAVKEEFNIEIRLTDLFRFASVKRLAVFVKSAMRETAL